ncbi:MAG: cysteine desulfurase, partial [Chloroflexi bacterium]
MNNGQIYLDYAATTPTDRRVLEAMLPYFSEVFGNPSSIHRFGQDGEAAVEEARETTAGILNCSPSEVVFTSCGSESDNFALRGAAFAARERRGASRILISPVEHHAVSHTARQLGKLHGFSIEELSVDEYGAVLVDAALSRLGPDVAVVSAIHANNEIGTINPIEEIGAACRERGIPFHTDSVQAAAYLPVDVQSLNVDLLSLGAHKFYGPKGVGALYVRKGTPIVPVQTGGAQEGGLRAGTQNVPYIVGFAEALRLTNEEREDRQAHVMPLRDRIIGTVLEEIPQSKLTGH